MAAAVTKSPSATTLNTSHASAVPSETLEAVTQKIKTLVDAYLVNHATEVRDFTLLLGMLGKIKEHFSDKMGVVAMNKIAQGYYEEQISRIEKEDEERVLRFYSETSAETAKRVFSKR